MGAYLDKDSLIMGFWKDKCIEGYGLALYKCGGYYLGNFKNGLKDGLG